MNIEQQRDAFEAAYCKHFTECTGIDTTPERMREMRVADTYGDRAYLNGMWEGYKLFHAYPSDAPEVPTLQDLFKRCWKADVKFTKDGVARQITATFRHTTEASGAFVSESVNLVSDLIALAETGEAQHG